MLRDGDVDFVVRVVESLRRKDLDATDPARRAPDFDPFLPYDPAMHVGDASETHVYLLNKFNVMAHHLLVVTRDLEDQLAPLSLRDLEAIGLALAGIDGLAFYNGGAEAGASQRHKHLQLVPTPLAAGAPALPIEAAFGPAWPSWPPATPQRVAALPFRHAVARLEDPGPAENGGRTLRQAAQGASDHRSLQADPDPKPSRTWRSPAAALRCFQDLCVACGLPGPATAPMPPYNLLMTRRWMMVVPRRRECFDGISVNALGFAGALLVRDQAQLERVRAVGPMRVLQAVTT